VGMGVWKDCRRAKGPPGGLRERETQELQKEGDGGTEGGGGRTYVGPGRTSLRLQWMAGLRQIGKVKRQRYTNKKRGNNMRGGGQKLRTRAAKGGASVNTDGLVELRGTVNDSKVKGQFGFVYVEGARGGWEEKKGCLQGVNSLGWGAQSKLAGVGETKKVKGADELVVSLFLGALALREKTEGCTGSYVPLHKRSKFKPKEISP